MFRHKHPSAGTERGFLFPGLPYGGSKPELQQLPCCCIVSLELLHLHTVQLPQLSSPHHKIFPALSSVIPCCTIRSSLHSPHPAPNNFPWDPTPPALQSPLHSTPVPCNFLCSPQHCETSCMLPLPASPGLLHASPPPILHNPPHASPIPYSLPSVPPYCTIWSSLCFLTM